jgi:hypothetical protein
LFFASPNTICLWVKRYSQSEICSTLTWHEALEFACSRIDNCVCGKRLLKKIVKVLSNTEVFATTPKDE